RLEQAQVKLPGKGKKFAEVSRTEWIGQSNVTANDIASPGYRRRGRAPDKLDQVVGLIQGMLTGGKSVEDKKMMEEIARLEISESTVNRARKQLGVKVKPKGFGAERVLWWSLPTKG